MRVFDRFLGIPICWLLGIYRLISPSRRKISSSNVVKNILVIKCFGLGSILLCTPALSILKKTFPQARLHFLSFASNRELLERIPLIDTVLTVDTSSFIGFIADTLKTLWHVRTTFYDVVFDFEFFSKYSTAISGFSGAPQRVGFALPTRWRSMLVTHPVLLSKDQHVSKAFCNQVFAKSFGDMLIF